MEETKKELMKQTALLERLVEIAEESKKDTNYQLRRIGTRLEELEK